MMQLRQKLMQWMYPIITQLGKASAHGLWLKDTNGKAQPLQQIPIVLNNGEVKDIADYRGQYLMIVNTASFCGYTAQYTALQQLFRQQPRPLTIIAVPANDFKDQEPEGDAAIAAFCTNVYQLGFPIAQKQSVVKGATQSALFQALSDVTVNGWNDRDPIWNFTKYLIDPSGKLVAVAGPAVTPNDERWQLFWQ